MDCKKAEKLLVEYLYQELSPRHTVDLERHLEVCDACSATLENWRAIHRGYQKAIEDTPAAPYLNQRILAAAKEELQRKPSFSEKFMAILRPALILPVLIFALIATLMLYKQDHKEMAVILPAKKPASAPEPVVKARDEIRAKQEAGSREQDRRAESVSNSRLDKDSEEKLQSLGSVSDDSSAGNKPDERAYESGAYESVDKKLKKAGADYYEQQKESQPTALEPKPEDIAKNEQYPASEAASAPPPPVAQAAPAKTAGLKDQSFEEAQSRFRENNLPEGQALAKRVIENDKSGQMAVQFHQAGIQYQNSKEPEQAIVQFNLVLNNYPKYNQSPDVLLRLAESYEQIGEYEQALKAYEQLAQFPSSRNTARQRIGDMQKRQKSRDQLRSLGYVDKNNKE
jgi:tetratricopeptide (TPR) repeat protein